jgi:hypothetical protein
MKRMKQNLIMGGLLLGALAVPVLASADDAAATAAATPAPTPVATAVPWYSKVTVGGYLDEYYQVSLNRPNDNQSSSVEPLQYRAYDNTINQFSFGGGELTLKQNDSASGTGYYVDLLMGSLASTYTGGGVSQDSLAIGQAYLTQTLGNATVTLGKFATPLGYEVTYLPSNANFSRSLLYGQEPTFNTGVRLDYTLPAGFVASGFVDNGNSTDDAMNNGKDYGAVLAYSGVKNLNLTGVWYLNNNNPVINSANSTTGLYDIEWANFIASYTASDSLSFAGEYLYKATVNNQPDSATNENYVANDGYALYATYNTPIANLSLSPRFEQWFNPNTGSAIGYPIATMMTGPATLPLQLNEYTITLKYVMGPLSHMIEYRCDASNRYEFVTGNIPSSSMPTFSQLQQTLTYAAVYSF